MNKKIIFLVAFLVLTCFCLPVMALEITYPNIPFAPTITEKSTLPQYISYWFSFGIMIAGVIALISMVIGAVQFVGSAGNPSMTGDAKDRIKGALLGMVLLVSSFILLQEINPVLVTPTLSTLPGTAGIFYTNGTETKPAPNSESNTNNIASGFKRIIYKCAEGGYSPNLFVWLFPGLNFSGNSGGYEGIQVSEISCGNSLALGDAGSFKMAFKTAGVYYYLGNNCSGYMSEAVLSDQAQIPSPFSGDARSIKIINMNGTNLGYVLHGSVDYRGYCDYPAVAGTNNSQCYTIISGLAPASISVFNVNPDVKSSGNNVSFYSKVFGAQNRVDKDKSGYYILNYEKIQNEKGANGLWSSLAKNMEFNYEGTSASEEEKTICKTFKDCPRSIKIEGNYIVGLYSEEGSSSLAYCQLFSKDIPNLNAESFTAENKLLKGVYVFPVK